MALKPSREKKNFHQVLRCWKVNWIKREKKSFSFLSSYFSPPLPSSSWCFFSLLIIFVHEMGSNVATFALAQQQNAIMLSHTHIYFHFFKFSSIRREAEEEKRKRLLEVTRQVLFLPFNESALLTHKKPSQKIFIISLPSSFSSCFPSWLRIMPLPPYQFLHFFYSTVTAFPLYLSLPLHIFFFSSSSSCVCYASFTYSFR